MGNQSSNSDCSYAHRRSHGRGLRPGVAKDQLIFIIICSVALTVAAVTMVHFFTGGSKRGQPNQWQCVACGHDFTMKKKMAMQPIECPKCGGEAVRLHYRTCPACGEKTLVCRLRMPRQALGSGAAEGPPGMGPGPMQSVEMQMQYWVKQNDGTYAWTPWVPASSGQAMQADQSLVCPECGESLSPLRRTGR